MSKKKKYDKETTIENYYDLKTKEMDELVAALKGEVDESRLEPVTKNIAEITGEKQTVGKDSKKADFDPYKVDKFARIPAWIKALFIKFWFAGLVSYFVNMGLAVYVTDPLDLMLIDGVLLGVLVDCMVNPIFRMMQSSDKEYDKYMMFPFPFKKYWTFITNILYYLVVIVCVEFIYYGINLLVQMIKGSLFVAVEPLLMGFLVLLVDMAFIGIKDLLVYLVKRRKRKKTEVEDV